MLYRLTTTSLILVYLGFAAIAGAAEQSVHIEWGYTPPSEPAVSGFLLYQEGTPVCQTQDPNATAMDCSVSLMENTNNFTLTALFTEGTESLHSAPFQLQFSQDPSSPPLPDSSTSQPFTFKWDFTGPTGYTCSGFKIYQNDTLLCETSNQETRELSCTVDSTNSTDDFRITAVYYGKEYPLSDTLTYTQDNQPVTPALSAAITANITQGTAPLTIGFDASSSTGNITGHHWSFGDGSTAKVNNINHTFTQPGAYTTKLTISDNEGNTSNETITITVTEAPVSNKAPTAVIASSTVTGEAPKSISFNGSGSTDADGSISNYAWSFGDGSSASGKYASHTFQNSGTFAVTLTVTDNQGTTNTTNTPIIITKQGEEVNQPPQAKISVTATSGLAPLTVSLSASGSTDSDGTIETYTWNFGDGTSATGISATHTYTAEAAYTATLQVADDKGMTAVASTTITVEPAADNQPISMEIGEVTINSNWKRIELEKSFTDPVIIAGPPTNNSADPGVVRLRNIDSSGFEIKITEWDYLDDSHADETVSYLVIEKGHYNINGVSIEAGTFTGKSWHKSAYFQEGFTDTPVVLTTIASVNETSTISGRLRSITPYKFQYYFREQEKNQNTHADEKINYIACEIGSLALGNISLEAARTANTVTHQWKDVAYQKATTKLPFIFADMQTIDGSNSSALRVQNISKASFQVKVEEEQSKDSEVTHPTEVVGTLIFTAD